MQLTTDLSGLSPAIRQRIIRRCQHEDKASYDLGVLEQKRMAKLMHEIKGVGLYKDLGPQVLHLSPDQHQRLMAKYGQMIFMDPDFVPWLLKKPMGEDMRSPDVRCKISSGYSGAGDTFKRLNRRAIATP